MTPGFWEGLFVGLFITPLVTLGLAAMLSWTYDFNEPKADSDGEDEGF